MAKKLMSGNEAIAQGAWEAGVSFATGYPGTPSTEVLENLAGTKGWTPSGPPMRRWPSTREWARPWGVFERWSP